jgi:hypothetical protein
MDTLQLLTEYLLEGTAFLAAVMSFSHGAGVTAEAVYGLFKKNS